MYQRVVSPLAWTDDNGCTSE